MAAGFEACLIDVYGTILTADFGAHRAELPALAGIPANAMYAEFARLAPALTVGELTRAEAYARILKACGAEPEPGLVRALTDRSRELLLAAGRLYDDALPFLRALRARGVRTAIVSNCDENTRPLLVSLGVAALAGALVLSCEVGMAKPDARIFRYALGRLGVTVDTAVFIDDTADFCAAAESLGMRAMQIMRDDSAGKVAWAGQVVRSLRDVEAML